MFVDGIKSEESTKQDHALAKQLKLPEFGATG